MSGKRCQHRLLAACGLLILGTPASAQLWSALDGKPQPPQATKRPKGTILCLPPGGTNPRPCAVAAAGSTLQLDTNLTGAAPLTVTFINRSGTGRARVPAKPIPGRDGSYVITAPRHLCGKDKLGNFEIQIATSDMNQAEASDHGSIGYFQMQC